MRKLAMLASTFTLVAWTAATAQQKQTNIVFPSPTFQMNGIPQSLKLNDQQMNQLNQLTTKTQDQFRPDYTKAGTVPAADRFSTNSALDTRYNSAWMSGAQKIFNDQQYQRYQQLHYQANPFLAFTSPKVQTQLNLTADQRAKLQADWTWNNAQVAEINRLAVTDPKAGQQAFDSYMKDRQTRINQFLTPTQQQTWQTMTGEPHQWKWQPPAAPATPKQ